MFKKYITKVTSGISSLFRRKDKFSYRLVGFDMDLEGPINREFLQRMLDGTVGEFDRYYDLLVETCPEASPSHVIL